MVGRNIGTLTRRVGLGSVQPIPIYSGAIRPTQIGISPIHDFSVGHITIPANQNTILVSHHVQRSPEIQRVIAGIQELQVPKRGYYSGKSLAPSDGQLTAVMELSIDQRKLPYPSPATNFNRLNPDIKGLQLVEGRKPALNSIIPRPIESPYYSTIFEARLTPNTHFPGKPERLHFQESNQQLYHFLESNPDLKMEFNTFYPGLYESIKPSQRGIYPNRPPQGLSWHHNTYEEGLIELIPRSHHQAAGPVHHNLHPNNKGGMEIWGGKRSGKKRMEKKND